jgi:hypothetical protein
MFKVVPDIFEVLNILAMNTDLLIKQIKKIGMDSYGIRVKTKLNPALRKFLERILFYCYLYPLFQDIQNQLLT